ncbi:MAG: response regulator [Segetibacter sp.]|jgi:CheY-like chemotaxis protein|nr:response regulator [Segetibacter sp.]
MNSNVDNNGPVIIIEDDIDDQEIFAEIFKHLAFTNELIFFGDGQEALDYLTTTEKIPFIIISDINLPTMDGFELRKKIREDAKLEVKCIPYLFFSTAMNQKSVIDAYSASSQGFFVKENSMAELEKTIKVIMEYWKRCASPNSFS